MNAPPQGELLRCTKCEFKIRIAAACNCKSCDVVLQCCGQDLERVAKS